MKRTSPIWKLDECQVRLLVEKHNSVSDILKEIGYNNIGGNVRTFRLMCKHRHINLDSLSQKAKNIQTENLKRKKQELHDILIENSTYHRWHLKVRLINEGLLENKCSLCGQLPFWNDTPLSLHIDHINGISNDNRIENLRLLCPNCHSQTSTYGAKNKKQN